jgi:hypothetical protein
MAVSRIESPRQSTFGLPVRHLAFGFVQERARHRATRRQMDAGAQFGKRVSQDLAPQECLPFVGHCAAAACAVRERLFAVLAARRNATTSADTGGARPSAKAISSLHLAAASIRSSKKSCLL